MKRSRLLVILIGLALSLALIGPAGAQDGVGFNVDCDGASGFGSVPAGATYNWFVRLWDPTTHTDAYWSGTVSGGDSGAQFDPVVVWPVEITPGTDPSSSYYWWGVFTPYGEFKDEGHFDCEPPPPPGESCTPGYWRNFRQHGDEWTLTPYSPDDDFDVTFGTDYFDPDITLGDAIWLGGGDVKKLARHGTAALLNAAHPGVVYPLTVDEVIAAVQAGDATTLADYNEYLFCPLN